MYKRLLVFGVVVIFLIIVLGYALFNRLQKEYPETGTVHIKKTESGFKLIKNNKEFFVQGGAGYTHFSEMKKCGGNTMRTWGTENLKEILDSAYINDLFVVVGLPIAQSYYLSFYQDKQKVRKQFEEYKAVVNEFKDHPALLMWGVGNEVGFPFRPAYYVFYNAFNQIVDMIHHDDPNHPVTTSLTNFTKNAVFNIRLKIPDLDLISFNTFGGKLHQLREDLETFTWFWEGPYMLTEWGITGYWESERTPWNVPFEETSNTKVEQIRALYEYRIPFEDERFLGSLIFYWGQKQEVTRTWFSLFDIYGEPTELAEAIEILWNNKAYVLDYPQLDYIKFDGINLDEDLVFNSNENIVAKIVMLNSSEDSLSIEWEVVKEDWYSYKYEAYFKPSIDAKLILGQDNLEVFIKTPPKEGPYRLFVRVKNSEGKLSRANVPFYVVDK